MGVEILDNGTRVLTAPGAAFGTDALLLARFAQPRQRERALDMCSGCGIVSLVWHDAGYRGPCTALELDAEASALCAGAAAENQTKASISDTFIVDQYQVISIYAGCMGGYFLLKAFLYVISGCLFSILKSILQSY